jgi:hypothetical protein
VKENDRQPKPTVGVLYAIMTEDQPSHPCKKKAHANAAAALRKSFNISDVDLGIVRWDAFALPLLH